MCGRSLRHCAAGATPTPVGSSRGSLSRTGAQGLHHLKYDRMRGHTFMPIRVNEKDIRNREIGFHKEKSYQLEHLGFVINGRVCVEKNYEIRD